jgi:hypothetical protein
MSSRVLAPLRVAKKGGAEVAAARSAAARASAARRAGGQRSGRAEEFQGSRGRVRLLAAAAAAAAAEGGAQAPPAEGARKGGRLLLPPPAPRVWKRDASVELWERTRETRGRTEGSSVRGAVRVVEAG